MPALTGARILAAAAVYLSHLRPPQTINPTIATFMAAGYNGVTFFFILSGFVLGLNYFDRLSSPTTRTTWNYAVARVARIYPLYLAVFLFVAAQFAIQGRGLAWLWLHALVLQAWATTPLIAFKYIGPAWSVSVETFLYACFPLLVLAVAPLRRKRSLAIALVLIVVANFALAAWFVQRGLDQLPFTDPASPHRWLYYIPLTRLGDFVAGLLLARLFSAGGQRRGNSTSARWFAYAGTTAVVLLMCSQSLLNSAWSWDAAYLVPALAIIWGLANLGSRTWLASTALVAAGGASYAFYLVHFNLMHALGSADWSENGTAVWAIEAIGTFALALALAFLLHYMIERPARTRINRLGSGRHSAAAPTAEASVGALSTVQNIGAQ